MKDPVVLPPVLALLPSVSYVEYGKAPLQYLGPCTALNDTSAAGTACSAYALEATVYGDGRRVARDLTPEIVVEAVPSCTTQQATAATGNGDDEQQPMCVTCTLEQLHLPGRCPPGTYTYRFTATNSKGDVATAQRTVHVYYKSSMQGTFLPTPLASYTSEETALLDAVALNESIALLAAATSSFERQQLLSNNASESYIIALSYAAGKLSPLGLDSSDVAIRAASVVAGANGLTAIQVDVEVFMFLPVAVHNGQLLDYETYAAAMSDPAFRSTQIAANLGYNTTTGAAIAPEDAARRRSLVAAPRDNDLLAAHPIPARGSAHGDALSTGLLAAEGHAVVEGLMAELLGGGAEASRLVARRMAPEVDLQALAASLYPHASQQDPRHGAVYQLLQTASTRAARRLQQASPTPSGVGNSTAVAGALNATGISVVDYTLAQVPDTPAAYVTAIEALAEVVSQQVQALLQQGQALGATVNATLGDGPLAADDRQREGVAAAYAQLIADSKAAEDATMAKWVQGAVRHQSLCVIGIVTGSADAQPLGPAVRHRREMGPG